ncbi:Inner membrane protein YihY, formerly thought to be RNase BN [hydrothermal vent metagenome]|uniref:Inner membrane protein YihY, formerly thought to be RNase BN n=1 Tax=hydrothermal vent metagenome TaxID=652676 RepID=A0A3B0XZ17_9ZZZZ
MSNQIMQRYDACASRLWRDDLRQLHGWRRNLIVPIRLLVVLTRQFISGELNLRAMSLVYTTLLSIVPLLAVSFSVLKGFGVHNQIEPLLLNFLAPLGPRGVELSTNIISFVENIKVGVLGSLGLLFLLYTVVSLIQKIESSFNYVWQVEHLRGLAQRFSSYLSVILIGPVLVFAALGMTATALNNSLVQQLMAVEPLGFLLLSMSKLAPYLLVIVAFSFIYIFIPNTRVNLRPALVGGLVAGVLWQSSGWAFAAFIASSAKYAAIYSGFAIMILLLIWLYLNWLILLLGAQVAFYAQYPQYMTREPVQLRLSNRLRERLALQIMFMVAEHHIYNRAPWTSAALVHHLGLPMQPIHHVLQLMVKTEYLAETAADPPAYLPRRGVETISLAELYEVVRCAGENRFLSLKTFPHQWQVEQAMTALQSAVRTELGEQSLRDLVERQNDGTAHIVSRDS